MTTATATQPANERDTRLAHHFTVDVEDYFQVSALESMVPRSRWLEYESRVERSTELLLTLLDARQARGTFFVLGWIAEHYPALVRRIAEAGHEIASHGWDHRKVTRSSPADFRESVRRTKICLEDLVGAEVLGFRAPSFSIVPGREWALDVLIEEGYAYDSSLFPVTRPGYGYRNGLRDRHTLSRPAGKLEEFPPATLLAAGMRLPAAGGAYLRLLPYRYTAGAFEQAEQRGVPTTFYVHPWELDPEQPRLKVPVSTRIRHYGGLRRTAPRIARLLENFRFRAIRDSLTRGGGE